MTNDIFADMDDLGSQPKKSSPVAFNPATTPSPTISCPKCNGRGSKTYGYVNITSYSCGTCKGTGKVTRKRIEMIERHKKAQATAASNLSSKISLFFKANPKEVAWMRAASERGFEFATNMLQRVSEKGELTVGMIDAIHRCMARDEQKLAERCKKQEERNVDLGEISAKKILDALNRALSAGLKKVKIRTGLVDFTPAKPTSRNPGHAYVTRGDLYLGKISPAGIFMPSRDCDEDTKAQIVEVAKDPLQAAIAHGKKWGNCACCGRELTDPVSVARGIGPICAAKYFGA